MSIRVTILLLIVAALVIYAWKDWFKSLCGLIVLMAVLQHPDMPRTVMGFAGLNAWNVLLVSVLFAWLAQRRGEGLKWDMPRHINILLLLYFTLLVFAFLRLMFDRGTMRGTILTLTIDNLVNPLKWVVPGLLLFHGCRTRRRLVWAMGSILMLYLVLVGQVVRYAPSSAAWDPAALAVSRRVLWKLIGYHTCDLSACLAGASWALAAAVPAMRRRWHKAALLAAAAVAAYATAVTGGRAGYVAWIGIGLIFCAIRWRKALLIAPAVAALLAVAFPSAVDRIFSGSVETGLSGEKTTDEAVVTSGRDKVWPMVVGKIAESPFVGHGRNAMIRAGLTARTREELKDEFGHPHNVYLECLLDNGAVGLAIVMSLWVVTVFHAARMFVDRSCRWSSVVGGVALATVLCQVIAGIGSQHYYPKESYVGMWAAVFLMFRVKVERSHARARALRSRGSTTRRIPSLPGSALLPAR